MSKRERGVIEHVRYGTEDHGVLTIWLSIKFGSSGAQGFGGIALGKTKDDKISRSYHNALCRCLGVGKIEEAVGVKVVALRCWGFFNDTIEGIENPDTGERFVHWRWRREVLGEGNTPLADRKRSLKSTIAWAKRRLEEAKRELAQADFDFTEW